MKNGDMRKRTAIRWQCGQCQEEAGLLWEHAITGKLRPIAAIVSAQSIIM